MDNTQKLKELIEKSEKILITSHVSPDPDSICSVLLLGTTLEANYTDKHIVMHSEELPEDLNFLDGFEKLTQKPLVEVLDDPDLIIMVDAMNFSRCTRSNAQVVTKHVEENNISLVIMDHHEPVGVENNELYINDGFPAAVQQVYKTLFYDLNLQKPGGFAQTTMTGLYSDTGGFAYLNDRYKDTLKLIDELLDTGIKIEVIRNLLQRYSEDHMKVLSELATNLSHQDDYSYSFLSGDFVDQWGEQGKPYSQMNVGTKIFMDNFIRNIDGRSWGFITYRDHLAGENTYTVSFRSVSGNPDVSLIAGKLSGGGHKGAAGAKITATSVEEAINKAKEAIAQSRL